MGGGASLANPRGPPMRGVDRDHTILTNIKPLFRPETTRKGAIPWEINNTHIYIPSPSPEIGGKAGSAENNIVDEVLVTNNQAKDGGESLHTDGKEDFIHSDTTSQVSETVFEEPLKEKGTNPECTTKEVSEEDEIEDPNSPKPLVRENVADPKKPV